MVKRKTIIFLIFILIIGFIGRFYRLGSFPEVFNRDEAAIGYNAYTILTEGRDEFGEKYPLTFKSFGDYKMPLYIYLTVPFVKFFGLNEFSVRFPSALFGSLTVLLLYLLVQEISGNKKIALISSFFLSIAPFHIHYSRLAFEANVSVFFILLGIYFFIIALKKPILFVLSSISFILALFCYFSPYFLIWPFILSLIIFYFKEIIQYKKQKEILLFLLLTFLGFLFALGTTISATKAKTNITIFGDDTTWEEMFKSRQEHGKNQQLLIKLYDNKFLFYGKGLLSNYFSSFSGDFLYLKGAKHPWHIIPQIGNLYLIDLLFLLIGCYVIIRKKDFKSLLLIIFFLLSPIPSAISTDAPHTTRLLVFLVFTVILTAYGMNYFLEIIKFKKVGLIFTICLYLYSFGFFLQSYLVHFPKQLNGSWLFGIKEAINYAYKNKDKYQKIIIDIGGFNSEDYIYVLFFSKYPLKDYLMTVDISQNKKGLKLIHVRSFDKYEFRGVDYSSEKNKNYLFIHQGINLYKNQLPFLKILKVIYTPDGKVGYYISEIQ